MTREEFNSDWSVVYRGRLALLEEDRIYVPWLNAMARIDRNDTKQREEIQRLTERNEEHRVVFQHANRELPLLRAEIERLREILKDAPHGFDCESHVRQSECAGNGKCNCWKSAIAAATSALEPTKGQES